ncbi:MAG: hypothetical protein BRC26_03625 [Nanohaloarchaea archaeon QH_8_44_6]|nr:MAG: hypothetical protein BRC26_03625 [Nanohaloarchaea archaeon QH_8_44_6]
MKAETVIEGLILLVGTFLLVNLLFFVYGQYSIHYQTEICSNIDSGDFSGENLAHSQEYYEKSCDSIEKAWKHIMEPPVKLKYHIIPVLAGLVATLPLVYYRVLESEFHSKGVQNWNERRP